MPDLTPVTPTVACPSTDPTATSSESTFADRHIGPRLAEQREMLAELGYASLDQMCADAVPSAIRSDRGLDLPTPTSEVGVLAELHDLAARNRLLAPLIGLGYYATSTPPVILRGVLQNPGWYTA